jgi:hypothetical protein
MVDWNKNGFATLAESVDCRGEDPAQQLEIHRQDIFFIGTEPPELKERTFNLTVYNGDSDLTFHGLSAKQICSIAEDMIRLVGGSFRIEPPPPPEIRF